MWKYYLIMEISTDSTFYVINVCKTHLIIAGLKKSAIWSPCTSACGDVKGCRQVFCQPNCRRANQDVPRASVLPVTALKCWRFNNRMIWFFWHKIVCCWSMLMNCDSSNIAVTLLLELGFKPFIFWFRSKCEMNSFWVH